MRLSLFDYNLPKELIAIEPAKPRDAARLFVYDGLNKKSIHSIFNKVGDFLEKGDVLVLNDTKVIPARLVGKLKHPDGVLGRKFKILLLKKKTSFSSHPLLLPLGKGENRLVRGRERGVWTALIDGKGRETGLEIFFGKKLQGKITKKLENGIWEIKFNKNGKILDNLIFKLGQMPLPPYIKQGEYKKENKNWYQTIFAKHAGSVAAPTAGLHFTPELLKKLKNKGVKIEYVTLHVGMGTFVPVKTAKIEEHKMHKEWAAISKKTASVLNKAKKDGKRIIACGTTSGRTLEAFVKNGKIFPGAKGTDIFIYPPRIFFTDALITNFHLPKSTLMMLVSAFLSPGKSKGIKILKNLYAEAIEKKYKFYSYGDAMLLENS